MCIYDIFKDDNRIYSLQGGNLPNPKNIQTIVQMHVPTNPQQIQVFNFIIFLCI
jgi:hypothetical protein